MPKKPEYIKTPGFIIEVPKDHRKGFFAAPKSPLVYWAFKNRPRVFISEKLIFTFNGKPVAEALVAKVEGPGKGEGEFQKWHKVYWKPVTFRRFRTASAAIVSKMKPSEAPEVLEVGQACFPEYPFEGIVNESLHGDYSHSYVAKLNGKIVGAYIIGTNQLPDIFPDKQTTPYLGKNGIEGVALFVLPEFRGAGVGRELRAIPLSSGADYIWGQHFEDLNNLQQWVNFGRKHVMTYKDSLGGNVHITTMDLKMGKTATSKKFYHGTKTANLDDILKNGLRVDKSEAHNEWHHAVYLACDPYTAANYEGMHGNGEPWTILEIDGRKLREEYMRPDDYDFPDLWNEEHDENWALQSWQTSLKVSCQIAYLADIPPAAIKVHPYKKENTAVQTQKDFLDAHTVEQVAQHFGITPEAAAKAKSEGVVKTADHDLETDSGETYWAGVGNAASGILPVCPQKGTVCLAWRSQYVQSPDCWGTIGGAVQQGKSAQQSAKAELQEETGYSGGISLTPAYVFTDGSFTYHNYIGVVGSEFSFSPKPLSKEEYMVLKSRLRPEQYHQLIPGWETDHIEWFKYETVLDDMNENPEDYHPGMLKLFKNSKDAIERALKIEKQEPSDGKTADMLPTAQPPDVRILPCPSGKKKYYDKATILMKERGMNGQPPAAYQCPKCHWWHMTSKPQSGPNPTYRKGGEQGHLFPSSQDAKFRQWFQGSKVVDANGNPMPVYHGTRSSVDFDTFSVDGPPTSDDMYEEPTSSGSGWDPTAFLGSHFAEESRVANQFAQGEGWTKSRYEGEREAPRVIQVFLRIVNPKDFGSESNLHNFIYQGKINDDEVLGIACRVETGYNPWEGDDDENVQKEIEAFYQKYENDQAFRVKENEYLMQQYRPMDMEDEMLRNAAYDLAMQARHKMEQSGVDGIRYKNEVEGGHAWIAFAPQQIKSVYSQFNPQDQRYTASKEADWKSKLLLPGALALGLGSPSMSPATLSPQQQQQQVQRRQEEEAEKTRQEQIDKLIEAISRAEGAKPELNNPGNLADFNTGEIRSFDSYEEGRDALEQQLNRIADGVHPKIKPDMTLREAGLIYSNGDPNWAHNVSLIMHVPQSIKMEQLIKGRGNQRADSGTPSTSKSGEWLKKAAGFAFRSFKKLWHVGDMNPKSKGEGSLEGAGLSVSIHPEEWMEIAEIGGPTWELTKAGNKFLNFHRLSKPQRKQITQWGVAAGYVTEIAIGWRWVYFDSEADEERYMEFETEQEAREEMEGQGEGEVVPAKGSSMRGTDKLKQRTMNPRADDMVVAFDLLVTVYAEEELDCDGVWWEDTFDPASLSAPRGVIFPAKLSSWRARKVKQGAVNAPSIVHRGPQGFNVEYHNEAGDRIGHLQIDVNGDTAIVKAIDTDENYQRQGIATKLYATAKRELKKRGVKVLKGSLEGSGPVQLREKVFGPGSTTYFHGGEPIDAQKAIQIMDVDYGYTRAETRLAAIEWKHVPVTDEWINRAKVFLKQKWEERHKELGREGIPTDLKGACKFASLFAQKLFGGRLVGNSDHQVLKHVNRIVDLTDIFDPNTFHHDKEFWMNPEHEESMKSCEPRVQQWVDEFMQQYWNDAYMKKSATTFYHGTSAEAAKQIAQNGIKAAPSVWATTDESTAESYARIKGERAGDDGAVVTFTWDYANTEPDPEYGEIDAESNRIIRGDVPLTAIKKIATEVYLYHGTSATAAEKILLEGVMEAGSYWGSERIADTYAEEAVDAEMDYEAEAEQAIFRIPLSRFNQANLKPDENSVAEPLTYTLKRKEDDLYAEWEQSQGTWQDSLRIYESVRYDSPLQITKNDRYL